jgi:hypothetical protein
MALAMLRSIKWLKNHGVMLTYARRGKEIPRVYVPPDGALTIGQARQLLGLGQMRLYRLREQGKLKFLGSGPVAMVSLAELRRLAAELRSQS